MMQNGEHVSSLIGWGRQVIKLAGKWVTAGQVGVELEAT